MQTERGTNMQQRDTDSEPYDAPFIMKFLQNN